MVDVNERRPTATRRPDRLAARRRPGDASAPRARSGVGATVGSLPSGAVRAHGDCQHPFA
ncbi:MAG: hypothetical protein CMH36_00770 [Microbacterium sp.]|uniref:Uncharacterized protein n=1 Tax=Microbacterium ginsengisoli TaxID=400772 RepID=A0A3C1KFL0_9MICO|nr:hypothetical protein ASF93_11595 [Microbacterium sp. Leaf347]KQS05760.1 hypothetical protein ASG00_08335 [Microbacterium sp. Leaf351]MAL05386.1 hypothetical protein [Microbacterium sp.]HAN25451.1 hypothetical protein [Microbacterium ginsengisoli]